VPRHPLTHRPFDLANKRNRPSDQGLRGSLPVTPQNRAIANAREPVDRGLIPSAYDCCTRGRDYGASWPSRRGWGPRSTGDPGVGGVRAQRSRLLRSWPSRRERRPQRPRPGPARAWRLWPPRSHPGRRRYRPPRVARRPGAIAARLQARLVSLPLLRRR